MKIKKPFLYILLVVFTFYSCTSMAQNISIEEFEKGISQSNVQVLDVRTAGEYQSGHLKDAFLADWTNQHQFIERVKSLDKSKPVFTYCLSGMRSGAAASWLRENGFTAYNMNGGIAGWKRAGKHLEAPVSVRQITMQEYLSLIPANKTVLVDVSAVWCPPCKKMKPIVDSLSAIGNFQLVTIDGGDQTEISKQLNVESFPTFIVYKNAKEVWRKSGIVTASELVLQLEGE